MTSIKTILISHIPLPYDKIGSWSTLYNNYLTKKNHLIDHIICPKTIYKYENIQYTFKEESFKSKVIEKLYKNNKLGYLKALKKTINPTQKYIIQIIDNIGICREVHRFLKKNYNINNFYIQYFYHGFSKFQNETIYSYVDEMILLTHDSYDLILRDVNVSPCRFNVLHNGIDVQKFYRLPVALKNKQKTEMDLHDKTIFIWCSQDRPKKGLHIILDAWSLIQEKYDNIELWIIGTEKKQSTKTIKYFGRIPNDDLPKLYQLADAYLFPTLWQEGFGLSLLEALNSGCYCIASHIGGVPEVLNYGKYGRLVKKPHFVDNWVVEIEEFIKNKHTHTHLQYPNNIYTTENWILNMNKIIKNAKNVLDNRNV